MKKIEGEEKKRVRI